MHFEKWYFDLQNGDHFGYYYICLLRIAGVCLTLSEIHQLGPKPFLHSGSIWGLGAKSSLRYLEIKGAKIDLNPHKTQLFIKHPAVKLKVCWHHLSPSLPQVKQPLFQNEDGSCTWKIWVPYASVDMEMEGEDSSPSRTSGSGYIDYLRLTIPFWKVPFRKLQWGRIFSVNGDWIILFDLISHNERQVYVIDQKGCHTMEKTESPEKNIIGKGSWRSEWLVGGQQLKLRKTKDLVSHYILHADRVEWQPSFLENWFKSMGHENKFLVEAVYNNTPYLGIMEEVHWDER